VLAQRTLTAPPPVCARAVPACVENLSFNDTASMHVVPRIT
jgi:hypothetical protein